MKDPSVTLGTYSHVLSDSQREYAEKVAELLDYSGLQKHGATQLIQLFWWGRWGSKLHPSLLSLAGGRRYRRLPKPIVRNVRNREPVSIWLLLVKTSARFHRRSLLHLGPSGKRTRHTSAASRC